MAVHGVCDRGKIFVVEVATLNGRRALTLTILLFHLLELDIGKRRTWTHPSLARTIRSIRSSSFCQSTSTMHVSSGNKELERIQS